MNTTKTISENLKPSTSTAPEVNEGKHPGRVDINHLIARVRKEKSAENRLTLIIFCLFALLIATVAILLSL
tara:strand:+ start:222 stop:434 length:213 start_codon:yes stop_codon:yes gene_type:complete